jgi:predicted anti-sigma-YlaC factor YlaD
MSCHEREIQILRWHEGELDRESEAALLRHLGTCAHCRSTADRFSEIDRLLLASPDPLVPSFLNEKIVASVIEEMRLGLWARGFHHFTACFAYFRPAAVAIILILGIGLGVLTGLSLSHSISPSSACASYDVLAQAGIERGGQGSSLAFIWTDTNGVGR